MRKVCPCGEPTDSLTGLCAECRLDARNARMTGKPVDPDEAVTPEQAIANVAAILRPHLTPQSAAELQKMSTPKERSA